MSIKQFLDRAAEAYYAGEPIISDEEFDSLAEQHQYLSVGFKHPNGIAHAFPMYSLQKVYPEEKLPFEGGVKSIKLDGAAISILFVDGKVALALTRGDGIRGQDITKNIMTLDFPKNLFTDSIFQITGEVVAPASIPNARNYAAGALNLKSSEEFATRKLSFVAYGTNSMTSCPTYMEDMEELFYWGFKTVLHSDLSEFPTDGFVVRVNNNEEYQKLGYTSHHPRGAYALKTQKEGIITTLKYVTWNVGRSGVVSPVAFLEPVEIDGAIVSKATLHNMKYIEALGLEEGCKVKVIRSGDIIPRIVERVAE